MGLDTELRFKHERVLHKSLLVLFYDSRFLTGNGDPKSSPSSLRYMRWRSLDESDSILQNKPPCGVPAKKETQVRHNLAHKLKKTWTIAEGSG